MKEEKVTKIFYREDGRILKEEIFLNGELLETTDRKYCKDPNTGSLKSSSAVTINLKDGTIRTQTCVYKNGLLLEEHRVTNEEDYIVHCESIENSYDINGNLIFSLTTEDNSLSDIFMYEYDDETDDIFTGSFRKYENGVCIQHIDFTNTTIFNDDGTSEQTVTNKNHFNEKVLESDIIKYDVNRNIVYSKYEDFANDNHTIVESIGTTVENDLLMYAFDKVEVKGEPIKYTLSEFKYDDKNMLIELKQTTVDSIDLETKKKFNINEEV